MPDNHLSCATILGPAAKTFLQGYVTCELNDIGDEFAIPMAITELKGRVLANGWVYGAEQSASLWIHASVADKVLDHLAPYLRFARCEIKLDTTSWYIARNPNTAIRAFKLKDRTYGLTTSPQEAIDSGKFQLETGYVLVSNPSSGKFLPQMLNLTDFGVVSFKKGCYLGQEVVARAEHRGQVKRRLLRLSHEGRKLHAGQTVATQRGDKAFVVASTAEASLVVTTATSVHEDVKLADPVTS